MRVNYPSLLSILFNDLLIMTFSVWLVGTDILPCEHQTLFLLMFSGDSFPHDFDDQYSDLRGCLLKMFSIILPCSRLLSLPGCPVLSSQCKKSDRLFLGSSFQCNGLETLGAINWAVIGNTSFVFCHSD